MGFQLTLGIRIGTKTTLESFTPGPNQQVFDFITKCLSSREPHFIYLWGEEGCGKTHLLQACCQRLVYQGHQAAYIDLSQVNNLEILKGFHQIKLICLDRLDKALTSNTNKAELVEFVNKALARGQKIFSSGRDILPKMMTSPFKVCEQFELVSLKDSDLQKALRRKAEERGLLLPPEIEEWILDQKDVSMNKINLYLNKIEQKYDLEKKKLNFSSIKRILLEVI